MPEFATYPSLKGKSIVITGGASGIGKEIVLAFAEQGAKIGFIDFDRDAGEALAAQHDNVTFANADLRDIDALKAAIADLREKNGAIDVLVNNAARDDRHDWKDVTPEYWDERMNTNLRHMFFAMQCCASDMIQKGEGAIVNIGSDSWWKAGGGFPVYATAKSAVHGLTRTMARDLGAHRIRVNCVVPGWTMTERQIKLWVTKDGMKADAERRCLPDAVSPIYIARMVLFLSSDDAGMCAASDFRVEAGSI